MASGSLSHPGGVRTRSRAPIGGVLPKFREGGPVK
eukprot:COSAG01_NODE_74003_length_230_cov_109.152672_1_plen_34_part_10